MLFFEGVMHGLRNGANEDKDGEKRKWEITNNKGRKREEDLRDTEHGRGQDLAILMSGLEGAPSRSWSFFQHSQVPSHPSK